MTSTPSADHLRVCGGSAGLFGPIAYGDDAPSREQRCRWSECPYRDEPWHQPQTSLPEPAGDFPTEVELCYCCVAELIPSGSRFSSFFCDDCRERVVALRDDAGRVIIPLGRHSMMNGIGIEGGGTRDEGRLAEFAAATTAFFGSIDRLCAWQRGVAADRIASSWPGARHVGVAEYLAAAGAGAGGKEEMFRQVCRFFGLRDAPR